MKCSCKKFFWKSGHSEQLLYHFFFFFLEKAICINLSFLEFFFWENLQQCDITRTTLFVKRMQSHVGHMLYCIREWGGQQKKGSPADSAIVCLCLPMEIFILFLVTAKIYSMAASLSVWGLKVFLCWQSNTMWVFEYYSAPVQHITHWPLGNSRYTVCALDEWQQLTSTSLLGRGLTHTCWDPLWCACPWVIFILMRHLVFHANTRGNIVIKLRSRLGNHPVWWQRESITQ